VSKAADAALSAAVANAAELWRVFGRARGHRIVERESFLAVDAAPEPGGLRILVLRPRVSDADEALIAALTGDRSDPVTVEDAFAGLRPAGALSRRFLPVMVRGPRPRPASAPTTVRVRTVSDAETLEQLERVVVDEFPVAAFQPRRRGAMFPPVMLANDAVTFFVAEVDGQVAGGCLTLVHHDGAGLYWVATAGPHRRQGAGRALVEAAVDHVGARPVTLSATEAGRPLYEQLGFRDVARAAWWHSSRPDARPPQPAGTG
jgi:GNAT superfamily N-acetyltransferase